MAYFLIQVYWVSKDFVPNGETEQFQVHFNYYHFRLLIPSEGWR